MVKAIPLGDGGYNALVDDPDYDRAMQYRWYLDERPHVNYAVALLRPSKKIVKSTRMHRFILDAPVGFVVDHINSDGLDNRRENLRIVSQQVNVRNSSGQVNLRQYVAYKGVEFSQRPRKKRWRARLCIDGRRVCLGYHYTEIEAATAYDLGVDRLLGGNAYKNFSTPSFMEKE